MAELILTFNQDMIAKTDSGLKIIELISSYYESFEISNPVFRLDYPSGSRLYLLLSKVGCSSVYEGENRDCYLVVNSVSEDLGKIESIRFNYESHATYMKPSNCIHFTQLIKILEVFVDSGKLPDKVAKWEYWGKIAVY